MILDTLLSEVTARLAISREIIRLQGLRDSGMPGWDDRIAELEAQLNPFKPRENNNSPSPLGNSAPNSHVGQNAPSVGGQRRVLLDANNPVLIVPSNQNRDRILLAVVDAATVFFSATFNDLSFLDDTQTPLHGWPMVGPTPIPLALDGYTDRLYARASSGAQLVRVEVVEFFKG
jgi:hypothetical protein